VSQVQEEVRLAQLQATVFDLFDATIHAMSDATIVTVQYAFTVLFLSCFLSFLSFSLFLSYFFPHFSLVLCNFCFHDKTFRFNMLSEGVDERLFQILDAITNPPIANFNQQLQKRLLLTLQKSATSLSALLYWNRQVCTLCFCLYSFSHVLVLLQFFNFA
jgi:hypothetical protein